jgi:hypothetical protein
MNSPDPRRVVIVDGDSAGREFVRELLARNVECLHLQSSARAVASPGFDSALYDADLGYVGDPDAAIRLLGELAPDAVAPGSERGGMFAELIAQGMNLPANKVELTGARRRALGHLRLARRASLEPGGGHRPQFVVNAVFQEGRPFVTDAWRVLLGAAESRRRLDGFALLDPDLAETEALLAFTGDALGKLGIVEGAAHAQLAWTADGPALVGAAACLAADPVDPSAHFAAGLNTQASVLADLLAGADRDRDAPAPHYRLARHMTKLLFTFSRAGAIVSLAGLARLRRLASFHSLHRSPARGDWIGGGKGRLADSGVVYLVDDEAGQVSADARLIRLWESRGQLEGPATLGASLRT